jgi:predicted DNA binding CopG/RHH family protein
MMANVPVISAFFDDEERELFELIESDDYIPGPSQLTKERLAELQAAAQVTLDAQRTKISLRVNNSDLAKLKARAAQEGMPYQTLINSILHKAVSG